MEAVAGEIAAPWDQSSPVNLTPVSRLTFENLAAHTLLSDPNAGIECERRVASRVAINKTGLSQHAADHRYTPPPPSAREEIAPAVPIHVASHVDERPVADSAFPSAIETALLLSQR